MDVDTPCGGASLVVLWGPAGIPGEFDYDYRRRHVPLVRAIPGMRGLRILRLRASTHHLLAELIFTGPEELRAAMRTPEAAAALADAQRLESRYGARAENHFAIPEQERP